LEINLIIVDFLHTIEFGWRDNDYVFQAEEKGWKNVTEKINSENHEII
jgi:hypothetical protein